MHPEIANLRKPNFVFFEIVENLSNSHSDCTILDLN